MNIWTYIDIFTVVFEMIVVFLFFNGILGCSNKQVLKNVLGIVFASLTMLLINKFVSSTMQIMMLINLVLLFVISLLFDGTILNKIFAACMCLVIMVSAEIITTFAMMILNSSSSASVLEEGNLRLVGIMVSKTISYFIVKLICSIKNNKRTRMPTIYWISLFTVPFVMTMATHLLFSMNEHIGSDIFTKDSAIATLGLLYSCAIVFYLFDVISQNAYVKNRALMIEYQLNEQVNHYDDLLIAQTEIRSVRHDMKNHMIMLDSYLKNGLNEDGRRYIGTIMNVIEKNDKVVNTNNPVIDSIINSKLTSAKGHNIKFTHTIEMPPNLKIDAVDACVIFANALDNAIEACERISEGDKFIDLTLLYRDNNLICKLKNSVDQRTIKIKNQNYQTIKSDKTNHGIGLENIKNVLSKYDGTLKINCENNEFTLFFVIYSV